MSDTVLYSVADGVATILLNRPQVMNALDARMIVQLREVAERAEHDAQARAVVIRGAGPAFLAGGDVSMFHANLARMPELVREGITILGIPFGKMCVEAFEGDNLVLMDPKTFEQLYVAASLLGDAMGFMKEEMIMQIGFESDVAIFARPPKQVELTVTSTEHAVKGDTANKVMKAAKLETGHSIMVPLFVEAGTVVRIDTETGEYLDRVKELKR